MLNEGLHLDQLRQQLTVFEGPTPYEILLVDGGSQDKTVPQLKKWGYAVEQTEQGRGQQLNAGVQKAKGDIVFFCHADSFFDQNPLPIIEHLASRHDFGAFPLRFDQDNWRLKLIALGSNWRLRYRKIAFGDQGMFMTRRFFEQMGGFKAIPLMEDYDFSLRARRAGVKVVVAPLVVTTSARRFRRYGIGKTWLTMQICQHLFRKGRPIEMIQKRYQQKKDGLVSNRKS